MEKQKFPEVRFKGFTDVWKQFRLGELCSEFRSGEFIKAEKIASSGNYPVYGGNGLRGYTDTYNHDGDFALIGRQGALCGNMQFSYGKAFFTEHAVAVKANTSNDTSFLYHLFGTMNLGQYSGQSAQPGLAVGNLIEIETLVPDKTEQTTIGNFFQNLDQSIVLHEKKFTQTQNLKKAMLEKMFPKAGSKQPEIRLKGFSGDWEHNRLGSITTFINGRAYRQEELLKQGKYPVLRVGNFNTNSYWYFSDLELDQKYYAEYGDLLYTWSTAFSPYIWNGKKVIYHYHIWKIELSSELDKLFTLYFLKADEIQLTNNTNGSTMIHVTKGEMENKIIVYPSLEEQNAIGRFFKQLDETLVLQQQQLQTLKNLKQAFLEKMFV